MYYQRHGWNIWYNEHCMSKSVSHAVSTLDLYHPSSRWPLGWYKVLGLIRHVIQILTWNIQYILNPSVVYFSENQLYMRVNKEYWFYQLQVVMIFLRLFWHFCNCKNMFALDMTFLYLLWHFCTCYVIFLYVLVMTLIWYIVVLVLLW